MFVVLAIFVTKLGHFVFCLILFCLVLTLEQSVETTKNLQTIFYKNNCSIRFLMRCIVLPLEGRKYLLLDRQGNITKFSTKDVTLPNQLFLDHFLTYITNLQSD